MKRKKVKLAIILLSAFALLVFNGNDFVYALDYVACGSANGIPKPIPQLTTIAYTLLMVAAPIVLIAFSTIVLVKAMLSGNADSVEKAKGKVIKKLILGVALFLTAGLVRFVITHITSNENDASSLKDCLSCFLYLENCHQSSSGSEVSKETTIDPYSDIARPSVMAGVGDALTPEQVEEELKKLTKAPTYDELLEMAKENYGMDESVFKIVFGWAINEGYDSAVNLDGKVDHYLGYLCDCIGINLYMGLDHVNSAYTLVEEIRGGGPTRIYNVYSISAKTNKAISNPSAYAAQYKGMYLALKYPDENVHNCYGPSVREQNYYKRLGGEVYYQGKAYPSAPHYPIQIWTQWYTGIKNWKKDK